MIPGLIGLTDYIFWMLFDYLLQAQSAQRKRAVLLINIVMNAVAVCISGFTFLLTLSALYDPFPGLAQSEKLWYKLPSVFVLLWRRVASRWKKWKSDSSRGLGIVSSWNKHCCFHLIWVGCNFGTHCLSVEIILFSFTPSFTALRHGRTLRRGWS